ncbi:MAG: hypothetical protein WDM77_11850 [Steroidobacteraceae bacterium]
MQAQSANRKKPALPQVLGHALILFIQERGPMPGRQRHKITAHLQIGEQRRDARDGHTGGQQRARRLALLIIQPDQGRGLLRAAHMLIKQPVTYLDCRHNDQQQHRELKDSGAFHAVLLGARGQGHCFGQRRREALQVILAVGQ